MDAEKMYWKKTREKLHKNVLSYIEQILETTLHKKTAVQLLTCHL